MLDDVFNLELSQESAYSCQLSGLFLLAPLSANNWPSTVVIEASAPSTEECMKTLDWKRTFQTNSTGPLHYVNTYSDP